MIDKQPLLNKCHQVFAVAQEKLLNLTTNHPDFFPMYTVNGKWKHDGEAWTNWCEGFLGGQLWLLYDYTGDEDWKQRAEHYSRLIEHRKTDRNVHDLGFLFWSTWKRWYDIVGTPEIEATVIEAGKTMGLRFKEKGGYLSSFVAPESLFIDIMMNVGIIFYAAQQTDDNALYQLTLQHCVTTRRHLIRGDGSASHEGIFDLNTGQFLRQSTHQGWRDDSSWARGLAWAIYGFGTVYTFTQDARFLQTACQCADYYILNTPDHGICPNDWSEPTPSQEYESSAAAITASGLLNLATLTADPLRANVYRDYALQIVDTLTEPEFLAVNDPEWEGILKHGSYHERKGLGVNESVMWGEYFFLEAVSKALKILKKGSH